MAFIERVDFGSAHCFEICLFFFPPAMLIGNSTQVGLTIYQHTGLIPSDYRPKYSEKPIKSSVLA